MAIRPINYDDREGHRPLLESVARAAPQLARVEVGGEENKRFSAGISNVPPSVAAPLAPLLYKHLTDQRWRCHTWAVDEPMLIISADASALSERGYSAERPNLHVRGVGNSPLLRPRGSGS